MPANSSSTSFEKRNATDEGTKENSLDLTQPLDTLGSKEDMLVVVVSSLAGSLLRGDEMEVGSCWLTNFVLFRPAINPAIDGID
jgi:hypothetical protein